MGAAAVFAVALVARLVELIHGGAATGPYGYDQSVYYAAADALLHGRVPYSGDFVFLHPPGIIIAGLPFALLGRLTSAATGFLAENIAFSVLASCTASLITVVARRAGIPRWAALAGGVTYATWSVTVLAGSSARLEPLGDLVLVLAVHLLGPGRDPSRRRLLLAGVVLGLLINVKVWWVVPIALLLLLAGPARGSVRERFVAPVAAVTTAALIDLPFLLMSRGHMFVSIVSAQLGRTDLQNTRSGGLERLSTMVRLGRLTGVGAVTGRLFGVHPQDANPGATIATLAVCALVVITSVMALRTVLGRVFVPVLTAQIVVLLAAPTYFPYYGDYVGVPLALVVAAAAGPVRWRRGALPWPLLWSASAAFTLALALTSPRPLSVVHAPDSEALTRATANIRCIVADTPWILIDLDALDRSFEGRCRNWVDFQGVGHGAGPDRTAYVVGRHATPAWHRVVSRYFGSGDALAISDPHAWALLTPAERRDLTRGPLLAESRGVLIFGTLRTSP